ncbi:hypothetical protein Francci3_2302 [Frankia casuarinae]|uniref:Uncharacterized protein n=1 Tax=Frankia casuarinae (strain DSM 45818 / CECT 9043 / HFP020203 / CcI3) TaxID=106370 RepID=Q2JAM2_FRACC|nr:hypothetical protein Francci3_2302 [Frankia casuarinae]
MLRPRIRGRAGRRAVRDCQRRRTRREPVRGMAAGWGPRPSPPWRTCMWVASRWDASALVATRSEVIPQYVQVYLAIMRSLRMLG